MGQKANPKTVKATIDVPEETSKRFKAVQCEGLKNEVIRGSIQNFLVAL